jgi:hypothetical protein
MFPLRCPSGRVLKISAEAALAARSHPVPMGACFRKRLMEAASPACNEFRNRHTISYLLVPFGGFDCRYLLPRSNGTSNCLYTMASIEIPWGAAATRMARSHDFSRQQHCSIIKKVTRRLATPVVSSPDPLFLVLCNERQVTK